MAIISLEIAFKPFILHGQFWNLHPNNYMSFSAYYGRGVVKEVLYLLYLQFLEQTPILPHGHTAGKCKTGFSTKLFFFFYLYTMLPKPRSQRGNLRRMQLRCLPLSTRLIPSLPNQKDKQNDFFKCSILITYHMVLQLNFCFPIHRPPNSLRSRKLCFIHLCVLNA